jgi:hypothetical protein
VLEHDLGHVGARLQIAAALEFEEVAFGTDDWFIFEPLQEARTAAA